MVVRFTHEVPLYLFAIARFEAKSEEFLLLPGGRIWIVRFPLPVVPPPPDALIAKVKDPCCVGVPVIAPLLVFKDNPGGNDPDARA